MEMKCLLNTAKAYNVQNGVARCNKTLNNYVTKAGENISEVIFDYGKGLVSKSEVTNSRIRSILTDGSVITYTKNRVGDVLVNDSGNESIAKNPKLWNELLSYIFKGLK